MLILLLWECFELCCFLLKCAEAGWLLEVSFHDLFCIACISGVGRPGASSLAPWESFWHLGAPWGTMGAAGRTRGGPESDFLDLGMVSSPHVQRFLGSDGLDFVFVWSDLFPGHSSHQFRIEILAVGARTTRFSY